MELDEDKTCRDINECERDSPCDHICENTEGRSALRFRRYNLNINFFPYSLSFSCKCINGFELSKEGGKCFDVDECRLGTHDCTHECINTEGSYSCACPENLELASDGKRCEHKNLCEYDNGGCSQICTFHHNQTICTCRRGFEVDKDESTQCNDIDECSFEHK